MFWYSPRFSWDSSMTGPTKSLGTMMVAFTKGSSTCSITVGLGNWEGLSTISMSPLVFTTS